MKTTSTLLISMLVMVSLSGLAQKPQKITQGYPEGSYLQQSAIDRQATDRMSNFQSLRQIRDIRNTNPGASIYNNRLKSDPIPESPVEKLDSLVDFYYDGELLEWVAEGAEYYLYDTKGRNYALWDSYFDLQTQTMIPQSKLEISYSSENQIIGQTEYNWNDVSKNWQRYNRTSMTLDVDGRPTVIDFYYWDDLSQKWVYDISDTTSYTGSGKVLTKVTYQYDTLSKIWTPVYLDEFNYDGSEFLVQQNTSYWLVDSVRWENTSETTYFNDALGRDTLAQDRYWDGFFWQESSQQRTGYDAAGNIVLEESYFWDGESEYIGSGKTDYMYDGSNRETESVSYVWDFFTSEWFIYGKQEYFYDLNGNMTEEISSLYDTATQVFTPDWKDTYEHDLAVQLSDVGMPFWWYDETGEGRDGLEAANKITSSIESDWNPQILTYVNSYITGLYYSGFLDSPVNDAVCQADFSWTLDVQDDKIVQFTDMSDSTVVSRYWMFGDGQTSTMMNPRHTYAIPGTYRVILTTADQGGFCSNTMVKQIKVGSPPCNASFSYTVDTVMQEVTLTNESEGSSLIYFWSFGDGSVAKTKDPVHLYEYPGIYQITLTVSNDLGNCMDQYTATVKTGDITCNADFVVFVDSSNNTASFRAKQVNPNNNYRWLLGDGTTASTPNHIQQFSDPGYYSATLTVSNDQTGCVESREETLLVGRPGQGGKAGFIYLVGDGNQVRFTNKSLGSNLTYYWDFNDTESSSLRDPQHTYALPGYYQVCLTITTEDGIRNTYCEQIFAGSNSGGQCLAQFEYALSNNGLRIACEDRSFGNPDEWKWIYNDGWSTAEQNPSWSTSTPQYLKVQQTIRNSANGCRDVAFALINMGAESSFKADFGYIVDSSNNKADTYPVDFVGVSLGDAGRLRWSFGDGTYDSTSINPTHNFPGPGTYEVCLTITNATTGKQDISCESIVIESITSIKEFNAAYVGLKSYPNPFRESTSIEIRLENETDVDLSVYDLMGRKVRTVLKDRRIAGTHTLNFEGSDLEEGNYYLILKTEAGTARTVLSIIK